MKTWMYDHFQILSLQTSKIYKLGPMAGLQIYSLRPILSVTKTDVSRRILVLDTSIFSRFGDTYNGTEGVNG